MRILVLLCCSFFLFSCNEITKSNNLTEREQSLAEREQEIKDKEEALLNAEKEDVEKQKAELAKEKEELQKAKVTVPREVKEAVKTTENSVTTQTSPDVFVGSYMRNLDNQQFDKAFEKCAIPNIKAFKSLSAYSSKSAYGGVTNVDVKKLRTVNETANSAKVYVSYYAEDPYNKDGDYEQYYHLTNCEGVWKITKIETLTMNQY